MKTQLKIPNGMRYKLSEPLIEADFFDLPDFYFD